jgi:hypothetical protein
LGDPDALQARFAVRTDRQLVGAGDATFAGRESRARQGDQRFLPRDPGQGPANKAMTVGQLQSYCDCYAKAFADTMSAEDLEKNKETLTPEARKRATEFSQQCAASTLKK